MEFKYVAFTKAGQKKEGIVEAENLDKAADKIQSKGWSLVEVSEASALGIEKLLELNIGGVPIQEKVLFFRQMSYMLGSGLPLVTGLEVLYKQAKNKAMKAALKTVVSDVRGGAQLYSALKKHPKIFRNVTINLIKAGEESGKLDEVFERLATDFEKQDEFMGKVRGAMIYPAIIMLLTVVVVVILMIFMIPAVEELYGEFEADLPFITRVLVSISNGARSIWGVLVLVFLIVGALFLRYYRNTKEGRLATDGFLLKIPVFGELTKKSALARFSSMFSMLLTSGVEILDALNLTAESLTNAVYSEALKSAAQAVEKGGSLAKVIEKFEEFPPIVSEMIDVGEKTGKLDEIADKMGDYFEREAAQMADNLTKLMEPAIMIIVGFIVGFIALAVYTPIFQLGNVIR